MSLLHSIITTVDADSQTYLKLVAEYLMERLQLPYIHVQLSSGSDGLLVYLEGTHFHSVKVDDEHHLKSEDYSYRYRDNAIKISIPANFKEKLHEETALLNYVFKFYFLNNDSNELNYDELTGVKSRKSLSRYLDNEEIHSVVMIDLDNFKSVNDTLGHSEGDNTLRKTGSFLRDICGDVYTPYRYGGDEFVLIPTSRFSNQDVKHFCEDLVLKFKSLDFVKNHSLSLSVGIANRENFPNSSVSELVNYADNALYISKYLGKGRITRATVSLLLFYPLRNKFYELWTLKDRIDINNSCVLVTVTDEESNKLVNSMLASRVRKLDFISRFSNHYLILFNNRVEHQTLESKLTSICTSEYFKSTYIDLNLECNYYKFMEIINKELI